MSKVFLGLVFIGVLISGFADENVEILKEAVKAFNKTTQKDAIKKKRNYYLDKTKWKVEELAGKWEFTYSIDNENFTDKVNLDKVTKDSIGMYVINGTNNIANKGVKYPIMCMYYEVINYICITFTDTYYIEYSLDEKNEYSIQGSYGFGYTEDEARKMMASGILPLIGSQPTSTTTLSDNYNSGSTTTSSSDSTYVTDLKNKTHSIGWYFWMSDSGKAYLASEKYGQNGAISIWNFTDNNKWRPVHNALAFDGYSGAGYNFSNVYLSNDKRKIIIESKISSNEFTNDLTNQSHEIGWYFWMSESNKAYLASGRESSGGVAIWNFTDDNKWQPVHNAPAFDGYPKADKVFNSVSISSDGSSITIK